MMSSRSALRLGRSLTFLALLLVTALPWFAAQGTGTGAAYTWQTALAGTNQLHGVTWDGQRFLAVGDKGALFTSVDGRAWQPVASGTSQPIAAAVAGPKGFVAVGAQGLLLQSPDAQKWSASQRPATPADLSGLTFGQSAGKGLYVAVGANGTILRSRDGQNWMTVNSPVTAELHAVAWGGAHGQARFVAVGDGGTILISADGKRWTLQNGGTADLYAVAWGNGRFVAVGQNGAALASTTGAAWLPVTTGTPLSLNGIAWMGSRFVAVGAAGTILMSVDGQRWQPQQGPSATWLHGVAFSGSEVVVVGDAGIIEVAGTYSISGKVTQNSNPSVGVGGVTITETPDGFTALTASDGTYIIAGVGNAAYTITPSLSPNVFMPSSSSVTVSNANVTGVNFSMIAVYTLSGAVIFPGGTPTPYPAVTIKGVAPPVYVFSTTSSTVDGSYSKLVLQVGVPWTVTPQPTGSWVFNPSSASVPMSGNTTLNFQALKEADITGTITATAGCSNANPITVTATSLDGFTFSVVVAGPGAYTLPVAQNKTYNVVASGAGYTFTPLSQTVPVGTVNVPGINFNATALWAISGQCTASADMGATWQPLAGATVTVKSGATTIGTATTDAGGNYSVYNIPTGTSFTVSASKAGYAQIGPPASGIVGCGNTTGINFQLLTAYNISGRVLYNGTTTGVAGVTVTASAGPPYIYTATTAADGTYTIPNVVGPAIYTVTPSKAGYAFTPASSSLFVIANMTGIDFTAQGTQVIQGNVSFSNAPAGNIANVQVTASISPYGTLSTLTNGGGNYTLNVPPLNGIVVTPSLQTYVFTPPSVTVDTTTPIPGTFTYNFTAPHVPLYTLSGAVSGFPGADTVTITAAPGFTATVAGNGPYSIAGLPAGTYTVTLAYNPACPPQVVTKNFTNPLHISANYSNANFTAAAMGVPTVTGVSPSSGAAAGGTTVTITGTNFTSCGLAVAFGLTPATSFTLVSPTQITAVSPAGTIGATVDVQVTTSAGTSAAVTADHFTYVGTYSINGFVYQTDGITPIAGATLTASGGHTATSGAGGAYTIPGLPNGTYTVTCGYSGLAFAPQSVTVNNADRTGINFTAQTAYSISGTVTLGASGLAGVTVTAGAYSTTTAADGTYTISGVPGGAYTVTPSLAGYTFTPATASVTLGPSATGVNFAASAAFSISGKVTAGSSGVSGVSVSAGTGLTATTAADGTYTISNVPPGTYTVTPSKTGYTFSPASASVTVGPSATGVNFTATAIFTISGKVTSGASGLAGVTLTTSPSSLTATTAANGTYTIQNVPAGTYTVTPSKSGYSFTPASRSVTVGPNATGTDFAASSLSVVASASPTSGNAPLTVAFTSTVAGGTSPYTYDWDFGDGTPHGTAASPSHTYSAAGTFAVILKVTDNASQSATDSHLSITVASVPLSVTASATPTSGVAPLTVAFSATATGGVAPYTYAWTFGDGATGTGATASHTYTSANTWSALVTVTDSNGTPANSSILTITTTAANPPVIIAIKKLQTPFRLKIVGSNFHASAVVKINGATWTDIAWKNPGVIIVKKGAALKAVLPKGVPVQITVTNTDDGGVSTGFPFVR